jgi:membrane protease YdiL (CAAX protease family)
LGGPDSAYGAFELLPALTPQILLVYVIALFEELALRGFLQGTLEKHLSLKRSIFLTGLLWTVLPLGYGMAQPLYGSHVMRIPGVSFLVCVAVLIIYSVPLGWLFARTRSIVPVALMHGTIALFHLGYGYDIHINHPQLHFVELALWVLVSWYAMGERRYVMRP